MPFLVPIFCRNSYWGFDTAIICLQYKTSQNHHFENICSVMINVYYKEEVEL